jgi:hypothetical protein
MQQRLDEQARGRDAPSTLGADAGRAGDGDTHASRKVLLARWAAKTAYSLNWSANYPRKVPLAHLRALRAGPELPRRVVSIANDYEGGSELFWIQSPTWPIETGRQTVETAAELAARSYKISLQLGNVLLMTAFWPEDGWLYRLVARMHRSMWPPHALWAVLPVAPDLTADSDDDHAAVFTFHVMLGAIERGALRGQPVLISPPT